MNDILKKTYAGWLGKLAGIRLGAPIEGWTYEKIRDELGEINGYVGELSRFAADDDSNGPMMFIRALNDYSLDPTAEQIGRTWLEYTPYQHGMFWWGGYGVSTEHTAYMNLASGIPAPRSGSIAQNGATVAEQIGGQIFIDTWGLVCPGDPDTAAELAQKAASVSHDGNGVYGGMFVAAAIALAYEEKDIKTVIQKALKYIPDNCEYARCIRSVGIFYEECPDDWRDGFDYVKHNWGYNRYPGNCHIIPNAAVMALAMFYGEGDFSKTLEICCMCGWDTDCNAGNVGAIMGVLVGLDGIDYDKWRKTLNDGCTAASVMGCLNYLDAPWCARYLDDIARRLADEESDGFDQYRRIYDFELPGSTHSFESEGGSVENGGNCLKCKGEGEYKVFRRTYRTPKWYMDDRYCPEATPEIFPGQSVVAIVGGENACARLYAVDMYSGNVIEGEKTALNGLTELRLDIPAMDSACIERIGLICEGDVTLDTMEICGRPDYTVDCAKLPVEKHHSAYASVSQFSNFKGHAYTDKSGLTVSCADRAAIFTGDIAWKDYAFTANITPLQLGVCEMLVRAQGALRSVAVQLSPDGLKIVRTDMENTVLAECAHEFETGKAYEFTVTCSGNNVSVIENGETILSAETDLPRGAIGFGARNGARMNVKYFGIAAI